MSDDNDKYGLDGKQITDIAERLRLLKAHKDTYTEKLSGINKEIEYIERIKLPDMMDDLGTTSMRLDGIGRLTISTDAFVSTKAAHKAELYEWLENNGHGDLITNTVNASTLKAFVKSLDKQGEEIPEDFINYTPYSKVTLYRS